MNHYLHSVCILSLLFLSASVCQPAKGVQADSSRLFHEQPIEGWEGDHSIWRVENREIVAGTPDARQSRNDFLCTTREYRDFDLRVKYKRGGNNGGVQFRGQRVSGKAEVSGYQADFAPAIDGFLYDESRRGKFLAQPDAATVARLNLGEWNSYHLRADGPRIRLWVNDVLTVDYTEEDPAIPRAGIIGLQIHKNATEIRYKDLVIEELADAAWKPDAGFHRLFNGLNLEGWHYEGEPDLKAAATATDGRYSAEAGCLVVNPEDKARGPHLRQLWTIRDFPQDFILKLEFRASPNADSGVFIRGKQIQCRDYSLAGPENYRRRLGSYHSQDWNTLEISVRGSAARCSCNGDVLETDFIVPATGAIGLEADRGTMEYRRIQVRIIESEISK